MLGVCCWPLSVVCSPACVVVPCLLRFACLLLIVARFGCCLKRCLRVGLRCCLLVVRHFGVARRVLFVVGCVCCVLRVV